MISVGGVFLAIAILGLALIPPGRSHMQFAMDDAPARGALIDRRSHPEWRQFLIHSALKRADELGRLRDLPGDLPASAAEPNSQFAGLPAARNGTGPEDETGSINVAPTATIPIDIGETSSFELPVAPVEERPPVARSPSVSVPPTDTPETEAVPAAAAAIEPPLSKVSVLPPAEQAKPVVVIRKRNLRKPAARSTAPATQSEIAVPPPFNFLQAFFASLSANQNAASVQPAAGRRPRVAPNKTAEIR